MAAYQLLIRGLPILCVKRKTSWYLTKIQVLALIGCNKNNGNIHAKSLRSIPAKQLMEEGLLKQGAINVKCNFIQLEDAMALITKYRFVSVKKIKQCIAESPYLCIANYAETLPKINIRLSESVSALPHVVTKKRKFEDESTAESEEEQDNIASAESEEIVSEPTNDEPPRKKPRFSAGVPGSSKSVEEKYEELRRYVKMQEDAVRIQAEAERIHMEMSRIRSGLDL